MKKIVFLAFSLLMAVTMANAQNVMLTKRSGVGVRAAFDYSKLYGLGEDWDMGDDDDAPSGTGFEAGLQARINLLPILQFTPEILFRYASLDMEDDNGFERTFTQMDLEIPLIVRALILNRFFLMVGPQIAFNLSNEAKMEFNMTDVLGNKYDHDVKENIEQGTFNFGLTFGAGVYIIQNLSIDFRMFMGLKDMYPDFKEDEIENLKYSQFINLYGAKLMSFKVGLNYWFI